MDVPWAIPNIVSEDVEYVKKILDSGWYTMGKEVRKLEEIMERYTGRRYAVAVNNGTSALEVMLRTMDIQHGDEVIVPALSFVATATSVSLVGATPVFCDVNKNITIDVDNIDELITKKTKAVIAVDFAGTPCEYSELIQKCKQRGIDLFVDGAHSLGSKYKGKSCLSYGIMSTCSFHAAKIFTTVEGGVVFTDDKDLAEKASAIRSHGETDKKYVHRFLGGNFRMTDIVAGFGIKQMQRYEKTLAQREKKVNLYKKLLSGKIDFLDIKDPDKICDNFLFLVFDEKRDLLADFLKKNGIDTRKQYPLTIPQQPIYNDKKSYPMAEKYCKTSLSPPLYAELTNEKIEYVCEKIIEFKEKEC
jgi:perosamine synthetase